MNCSRLYSCAQGQGTMTQQGALTQPYPVLEPCHLLKDFWTHLGQNIHSGQFWVVLEWIIYFFLMFFCIFYFKKFSSPRGRQLSVNHSPIVSKSFDGLYIERQEGLLWLIQKINLRTRNTEHRPSMFPLFSALNPKPISLGNSTLGSQMFSELCSLFNSWA